MAHSEYCITAGAFARLCGTTRETLRYYHRQGVLVPRRNPANGYYYYSYAQLSSFYFITTFRHLGCSVADIQAYLLAGEQDKFDAFVDRQYDALLKQRAELEQKISVIDGTRRLLKEIRRADTGSPSLQILPEEMRLKLTPVRSRPAASSAQIMPDILRYLSGSLGPGLQLFPIGGCMGAEDFMAGRYSYRQVFGFAGSASGGDILSLAGRRAAVSVCRDSDGEIEEVYRALAAFLARQGLTPCSDVFSLSIVNVIDPHETRRYLKYLFVCVEQKKPI